jgi:hypothetical protein
VFLLIFAAGDRLLKNTGKLLNFAAGGRLKTRRRKIIDLLPPEADL